VILLKERILIENNEASGAELIAYSDFTKIDIRAGTIRSVGINAKARNPAYILKIDFGTNYGIKTSSAQITEAYTVEDLIGRQIVAVMNFEPKRVAGVISEVLVLAIVQHGEPTVLLSPLDSVKNGSQMA
jgi:tRNA-binding protein